jgi:hypothetical protein
MGRHEEISEQTAIRRSLLANGYVPLANKDKMCVLSRWPSMHVDDAQIDTWSHQLKWRATGVRVQGGLAVIDLDVNNVDAISAIIDALPEEIWSILQHAPVRRGKGAKEAWFCRLADGEEGFYRLASAGFRQAEGDETIHRVEIFADPDGGRQFGAYGAHTIGDDDKVEVVYQWVDDRGLLQVPFSNLPVLTRAQLSAVADIASRTLKVAGWLPDLRSKSGFSSNQPIFDLDAQVFETRDHGEMGLEELEATCNAVGDVRLSASWLEGASAINMTRCIATINPFDDRVSILETASFSVHRPRDMDVNLRLERLGEYFLRPEMLAAYEASTFWNAPPAAIGLAAGNRTRIQIFAGQVTNAVIMTTTHLAAANDVYDYGDQIALVRDGAVLVLSQDRLAFELGLRFQYFKVGRDNNETNVNPPLNLVKQLSTLGRERRLATLRGLIDMPIILPNGRLVSEVGYDPASELYLAPQRGLLPVIMENPSDDELRKALDVLWKPFRTFPFVSANDRGGMLAALLTAVLRKSLPAAPAFGFDAPTQGSGKTLLAKCVSELAGGCRLSAPLPTKNEEELAKILVSTLISGPRAVIFDNQLGTLDSASFAAALTAPIYEGRLLGASKMIALPTNCLFMLTGNNLSFGGDMPRRVVKIRIDAELEAPFTRMFDLDPEVYVRENRASLCGAALTLVSAALPHAAAGRLGSFEDWDRMVAQSVVWIARVLEDPSFGDPFALIGESFQADPHREDLITLLEGLRERFGNERFTARDVREHLAPGSGARAALRDVVESLCARMNVHAIGQMLKNRVGRRVGGLYLAVRLNEKTANEFQVFSEADLPNQKVFGTTSSMPVRLAAVINSVPKSG